MNKPTLFYSVHFNAEKNLFPKDIRKTILNRALERKVLNFSSDSEIICLAREGYGQTGIYSFIMPVDETRPKLKFGLYTNKEIDKLPLEKREPYKSIINAGGNIFPREVCTYNNRLLQQKIYLNLFQEHSFENLFKAYLSANNNGDVRLAVINGPQREKDDVIRLFSRLVGKFANLKELKLS